MGVENDWMRGKELWTDEADPITGRIRSVFVPFRDQYEEAILQQRMAKIKAWQLKRYEKQKNLDNALCYGALAKDCVRLREAGWARLWGRLAAQCGHLAGVGQ